MAGEIQGDTMSKWDWIEFIIVGVVGVGGIICLYWFFVVLGAIREIP